MLIKPKSYWEQIPKEWLRDSRLSFKALGILCKLQSLPSSWDFSIRGLAAIMKDGTESIRSGVNELEELGYLTRRGQKRGADGTMSGGDWIVHRIPFDKEDECDSNSTERKDTNPMSENTTSGKATQIEKERRRELKTAPMGGGSQSAVKVEKWDFDSKGNWKRKRTVYTTVDEADKIEEAGKDEYIQFGFWPSPVQVGQLDKMKNMNEKKTKLKVEYPEEEKSEEKWSPFDDQ